MPQIPARCHVPANGQPDDLAERGIGGTGGAARPPPPEPIRPSLGIAGIIDGFGSVCVDGLEVGLLPGTIVIADGTPARAGDLRIGQQAVLAAAWANGRPVTDRLLIRHLVVGPIDRTAEGSRLIVAGQAVRLSDAAWVDTPLRRGDWVSVSGLRAPSGEILASRIDAASGPTVLLHGRLEGTQSQPRIGALAILASGARTPLGSDVVLSGIEEGGRLRVTEMRPDLLLEDPVALFGGTVHQFLFQRLIGSGVEPMASVKMSLAAPPDPAIPAGMLPALVRIDANANGALSAPAPMAGIGGWAAPPASANPPSHSSPSALPGGTSAGQRPPGSRPAQGHRASQP